MRKQFVNKPLILCYCQTTGLLELPQMLGLLGRGLSLVEAKEKVTLEHFLAEPHPSPPTAAVWTAFLLGLRAGGVGGGVGALHLPRVYHPHSFKVKSQTEFRAPSPPTPTPRVRGWGTCGML